MIYDSFRSNPKINAILNSEQFPYSETIMEFRIKNELDIKQISNLLKITPGEYLDYEYCNLNIPTEKYISTLEKLNQMLDWVSGYFFYTLHSQLNATVGATPIVWWRLKNHI